MKLSGLFSLLLRMPYVLYSVHPPVLIIKVVYTHRQKLPLSELLSPILYYQLR